MGSSGAGVVVGGFVSGCFSFLACLCFWPIILIELSNHDYFSTAS